jgi:hypothetical protein
MVKTTFRIPPRKRLTDSEETSRSSLLGQLHGRQARCEWTCPTQVFQFGPSEVRSFFHSDI